MQSINCVIERENVINRTPRVKQLEGMFDIPISEKTRHKWIHKYTLPENWNIGLIVGPSGSGKSTLLKELFSDCVDMSYSWSSNALVDDFPRSMPMRDIVEILCKIGFSSPPSWLKPFSVLSNGEKFRVSMARLLCEMPEGKIIPVDEFTSVVDRTVAQIGSCALSKLVRKQNKRIVLASCHYDIIEWLCPDWIVDLQKMELARGSLQRPSIELEIHRTTPEAWKIFKDHHYLSSDLAHSAYCFVGYVKDRPAVFSAVMMFPHPKSPSWREHRTVCLPDFQGVALGNTMSDYIASIFASDKPYTSVSSNPAIISYRNRSPNWILTSKPIFRSKQGKTTSMSVLNHATTRLVASFKWCGPKNREDFLKFCRES